MPDNGIVGGLWDTLAGDNGAGELDAMLKRYREMYNNRQAPQAGPAAQSALSSFRQNQSGLVDRLEALSQGRGPSLAAEQLKQATDRNMATQASIAVSGRGNAGLAGIQASNMAGQLGAQAAGQSAVARIQEQQMALEQLNQALSSARGADEANSQFNALQTNYREQANLEAKLRTMGLNDAQIQSILAQQLQRVAMPSSTEKALGAATSLAGAYSAYKGSGGAGAGGGISGAHWANGAPWDTGYQG